jgi:aspartate aminotransferase
MTDNPISHRSETALNSLAPLLQFFTQSRWADRFGRPGVCDFTIGNPHDMPPPAFVETLQNALRPQDCYWYAYKTNEEATRGVIAESLQQWRGVTFATDDIFVTNGATGALAVVLHTVVDPGDEVIYISPSWFMYEAMIINTGGVPVCINAEPESFDLDLSAIESAITPKTRAVIINSPHNPTGRVYSEQVLEELAEILVRAREKTGRTVYLISDEAYARIVFDGKSYPSPSAFYDCTFLVYTYGKVLLTPGQRIGYVALPPGMPERRKLRKALLSQQMLNSWAFPNALMQHSLGELEKIPFDLEKLQRKRDLVVRALREVGYSVNKPEGTFYCLVRSPLSDDRAFAEMLAERDVFCIPASLQGAYGYFRISLTASEQMIRRALPIFAEVIQQTAAAAAASYT